MKLNLDKKLLVYSCIVLLFSAGFFIGFKIIKTPQSQKVLAQSSQPVKIHNLRFKKLVYQYLVNYRGDRDTKLTQHKINELMGLLEDKLYFTAVTEKNGRLILLKAIGGANGEILERVLVNGFEKKSNYQFYTGNTSNKNNHNMWDWQLYRLLTDKSLAARLTSGFLNYPDLAEYSTIRSLAFDFSEVDQLIKAIIETKSLGYIAAGVTDTMLVPKLRAKKDLTPSALHRLYETPLFTNLQDLGYEQKICPDGTSGCSLGWYPEELQILNAALELNNEVANRIKNGDFWNPGTSTYEEALAIHKNMKDMMVTAMGATGIVKEGASGLGAQGVKTGGVGFVKSTKPAIYSFKGSSGAVYEMSQVDKRFITGGLQQGPELYYPPTKLRGQVLDRAIAHILDTENYVNDYFGREFLSDYKILIIDGPSLPFDGLIIWEQKK